MSEDASQRLDELKLLWESDPSSKVYLQLASVYRQKGQLDKAVEVLETSLQHRPRDPRGRVALARCKMEQKDHGTAAELLEEVIRQDAAHVEANKQLLECYLQLGDADKAEERLNIYKLLNDRDPELDHLEYRLSSLQDDGEEPPEAPAASESAESESAQSEPASTPQEAAEPPVAEPPEAESAGAESASAEPASTESSSAESSSAEPPPVPNASPPEPADSADSPEPAQSNESSEPELPIEEPEPAADERRTGEEEILFDLAPPPTAQGADQAGGPGDDPWGGDLFDLAPPDAAQTAEPDLGGLWEQTEIVDLAEEETGDEAGEELEAEADEDDVEDAVEDASDEGDSATATLGLLYLKQGHLDEAATIFQKVLSQDAENEAALAGLEQLETLRHAEAPEAIEGSERVAEAEAAAEPEPEVAAQPESTAEPEPEPEAEPQAETATETSEAEVEEPAGAAPDVAAPALTAQALLGRVALEGPMPDDATGRRIAMLQQYIQQIRTASGDHVH